MKKKNANFTHNQTARTIKKGSIERDRLQISLKGNC